MTLATCAVGALARLYVEPGNAPHTFDASSESYEFLAESMRKHGTLVYPPGIRGTRSRFANRVRSGPYFVRGQILMNIDPAMLDLWLPRILGAAASGTTFALAETIPAFGVLIDKVTQRFEYTDCYINSAILRGHANQMGAQPQPLQLALDIVGVTRALGTSVPAVNISTASNTAPYIFEDMTLTALSATRDVLDFTLIVHNHLSVRFVNSLTATAICPQDRTGRLSVNVPYISTNTDLLDQSVAGAAGTLAFTNATVSLSIAIANMKAPSIDPVVNGKGEIVLPLTFDLYKSGSTNEIIATNDSQV